jgi:hypothetical protein
MVLVDRTMLINSYKSTILLWLLSHFIPVAIASPLISWHRQARVAAAGHTATAGHAAAAAE